MFRDFAILVLNSWSCETSVVAKLLQDLLERDKLNENHIMVLFVLKLDGEVAGRVHLEVLLRINGWEVNSIHQVIQVRLSVSEMLSGKFAILDVWVDLLDIGGSADNLSKPLPVEDLTDEVQSLLEVIVE